MTPKFVPVIDINNQAVYPGNSINGVRAQHNDWASLFKDPGVGDSLANTMRHWDQECVVDIPFLIVGGAKSIAEVLDSGRNLRFSTPYEGGVVVLLTKENKMIGKSYTVALVMPSKFCINANAKPIATVSELRSKVNQSMMENLNRSPRSSPGEGLASFRSNWQRFAFIFSRYIDV